MTGLYVYGALLMALSFLVGFVSHDPWLQAIAIVACGVAALSEAMRDVAQSTFYWPSGGWVVNITAFLSWILTALAAVYAVLSLIGGV